jgi:hypothetical protein
VAREVQEGWTLEPMAHEPERDPACAFLCSDRSFRNKTMNCYPIARTGVLWLLDTASKYDFSALSVYVFS